MKPDGPYHCTGELHLRAADGTAIAEVDETWLCACGASNDKPYCDCSHVRTEFATTASRRTAATSTDAFGDPAAPVDDPTHCALNIRTRKDGPLKVTGPVEVLAPDGALLLRGEEAALCRCGHSTTKPFCDGTHRTIGFTA